MNFIYPKGNYILLLISSKFLQSVFIDGDTVGRKDLQAYDWRLLLDDGNTIVIAC